MIVREKDYLTHHGVKGMKWGVRREKKDFKKLTRALKNANSAYDDLMTDKGTKRFYINNGTGRPVFIGDSKKIKRMEKTRDVANNIISDLNKKYKNVSYISKKDEKTGRNYIEYVMGDMSGSFTTEYSKRQGFRD